MPNPKTAGIPAAFFDFDKTLLNGESQAMEARYLLEKNRFSPVYGLKIMGVWLAGLAFKRHWISPWRYNQLYVRTYKGQSIDWLREWGRELYIRRIRPALFEDMKRVMESHRRQGHAIVLVSATAEHLLTPVKIDLDADFMIATRLETTPEGICTGKAKGRICVGKQKRRLIQRLARIHGMDIAASHAYSDHHADIPFLSAVGYPVAVNPTRKLKDAANQKKWRIMKAGGRVMKMMNDEMIT